MNPLSRPSQGEKKSQGINPVRASVRSSSTVAARFMRAIFTDPPIEEACDGRVGNPRRAGRWSGGANSNPKMWCARTERPDIGSPCLPGNLPASSSGGGCPWQELVRTQARKTR